MCDGGGCTKGGTSRLGWKEIGGEENGGVGVGTVCGSSCTAVCNGEGGDTVEVWTGTVEGVTVGCWKTSVSGGGEMERFEFGSEFKIE